MITTLIFDLDGLLADTEKLHQQAYRDVLGELEIPVSNRQYEEHWIRDGRGIAEFLADRGLSADPADVRRRKASRYRELILARVDAMPGALKTLEALHGHKTLALATSSYEDAARAVLDALGIADYFACIATASNAARTKPYPDCFLWVASALGVAPAQCLVVEDAEKGVVAAAAAGMRCVAIPNAHTRDNDFSRAALVLPSLDALTLEQIERIERMPPVPNGHGPS